MGVTGVRLYGVTPLGTAEDRPIVDSTTMVVVRDLAAIVREAAYIVPPMDDQEILECGRIVEEVFRQRTILPAPCGTVFRSEEHLHRWLDMNYVALVEGIHFVDGRCEARVHASDAMPHVEDEEIDLNAHASEAFRTLRKFAVASLPLRPDEDRLLSGAFLLDRVDFTAFEGRVEEQERRVGRLQFEITGPWPPYDFVRMDFGV
jgi:hypothetical protein